MKIHRATPHNESCGALRKFCALTLLQFHGNTSSITAKLCLVSTQNLLANHSCSIMRYCLKDCGLARAVFFNQSVNLSLPDGQIDILENLIRTIALLNVVQ